MTEHTAQSEHTELVERLRSQRHMTQGDGISALLETATSAADVIEAQADRIKVLTQALERIKKRTDGVRSLTAVTYDIRHIAIAALRTLGLDE